MILAQFLSEVIKSYFIPSFSVLSKEKKKQISLSLFLSPSLSQDFFIHCHSR